MSQTSTTKLRYINYALGKISCSSDASPEAKKLAGLVASHMRSAAEAKATGADKKLAAEMDFELFKAAGYGTEAKLMSNWIYDGVDRSIDLRISRLRKKLGDDSAKPHRIKSVRGVGYMLSMEP